MRMRVLVCSVQMAKLNISYCYELHVVNLNKGMKLRGCCLFTNSQWLISLHLWKKKKGTAIQLPFYIFTAQCFIF